MTLFWSSGPLRYDRPRPSAFKLIIEADQGLADYYRKLVPKYMKISPQMYRAHVSVVRKEVPSASPDLWGKYEGEVVTFSYAPKIQTDGRYFWLDCWADRLNDIRVELGLTPFRSWRGCFHLTIGNCKNP